MLGERTGREFRGLLNFYQNYRGRFVGAIILSIGSALLSLLLPLVLSFTVDTVLNAQAPALIAPLARLYDDIGGRGFLIGNLWLIGLILLLITGFESLLTFYRGKWNSQFAESGALQMRKALFNHIQELPFAYHARAETGDLIQRCTSDVETISKFFNAQLLEIIRSLTLIIFSLIVMFRFDVKMSLIGLAATPVIFLTSALYFRRERDAFQKWDEAEGALSATLQENLTGIRVVKAFARQVHEGQKFDRKNQELLAHGWKTYQVIANFWMFSDFICLFQIGAVTITGTWEAIAGRLTLGGLVIFVSYTEMLLYPLRGLARILADAGKMQISNARLQEILDEPVEPDDAGLEEPVLQGAIDFEHVSFRYGSDQRLVLEDVSFHISPGETIGLIGPTGAGKSTLLYLLQRLYEPESGRIALDGKDLGTLRRDSVRRQIGLILQESFVYSRSVFENIRLPRPEAEAEEVFGAARSAALHDEILSFESGYETQVGERGVTLSGGQKQRLTIARTLIRECPVIIFDDSMSSVDTQTDLQIREELRKRRNQATTLIVSHRISTLAEADRILVLENGRITAMGTHQQLIKTPGLYQRVYDIQNSLEAVDSMNRGGQS